MWLRDTGVAIGGNVTVELAPEGPQRGDLADDIATAHLPTLSTAQLAQVKSAVSVGQRP